MTFKIAKEKKVLVTGGTGFIAGWLIKQFNPEVVVQYHVNWDHKYK